MTHCQWRHLGICNIERDEGIARLGLKQNPENSHEISDHLQIFRWAVPETVRVLWLFASYQEQRRGHWNKMSSVLSKQHAQLSSLPDRDWERSDHYLKLSNHELPMMPPQPRHVATMFPRLHAISPATGMSNLARIWTSCCCDHSSIMISPFKSQESRTMASTSLERALNG